MDVRGTGRSGGEYHYQCKREQRDLYETIEWIARQRWSSGKVGGIGQSYFARSQWFMATQNPPHLACVAPYDGHIDTYRDIGLYRRHPRPLPDHLVGPGADRQRLSRAGQAALRRMGLSRPGEAPSDLRCVVEGARRRREARADQGAGVLDRRVEQGRSPPQRQHRRISARRRAEEACSCSGRPTSTPRSPIIRASPSTRNICCRSTTAISRAGGPLISTSPRCAISSPAPTGSRARRPGRRATSTTRHSIWRAGRAAASPRSMTAVARARDAGHGRRRHGVRLSQRRLAHGRRRLRAATGGPTWCGASSPSSRRPSRTMSRSPARSSWCCTPPPRATDTDFFVKLSEQMAQAPEDRAARPPARLAHRHQGLA